MRNEAVQQLSLHNAGKHLAAQLVPWSNTCLGSLHAAHPCPETPLHHTTSRDTITGSQPAAVIAFGMDAGSCLKLKMFSSCPLRTKVKKSATALRSTLA
jgi:hypothetical protein